MVAYNDNYITDACDTLPPPLLDLSWDRISPGISDISAFYFSKRFLRKIYWNCFHMEKKIITGLEGFLLPSGFQTWSTSAWCVYQFHSESANEFTASVISQFFLVFLSSLLSHTYFFILMRLPAGIRQEAVIQGHVKHRGITVLGGHHPIGFGSKRWTKKASKPCKPAFHPVYSLWQITNFRLRSNFYFCKC